MPLLHTSVQPETHPTPAGSTAGQGGNAATDLERRGRWWLVASFLACPCHLPITLAVLGTVLGVPETRRAGLQGRWGVIRCEQIDGWARRCLGSE